MIRRATPSDQAGVERLLAAQLAEHGVALEGSALSDGLARLLAEPSLGAVLLAMREQEAIGVAVLAFTWTLELGGLVAWLDELFVEPVERASGIGTRLLHGALEEARQSGCRAVELEVDEEHARAANLYAREGFTRLPRRRWQRKLGQ